MQTPLINFLLFSPQEVHDYLKSLCPSLHITRGEYDEDARYPETKTLTIGQFKLAFDQEREPLDDQDRANSLPPIFYPSCPERILWD